MVDEDMSRLQQESKVAVPFARHSLGEEEVAEVARVLRSEWITMGPLTMEFERRFAELVGCRHAVALSSCTAALHLALVAGAIGPGDEVIVPSLTFAATANVVVHVGATPVFADVSPDTLCLDPQDVSGRLTENTKAISLVHYGGRPGPVDELMAIAGEAGALLVEDAAHAVWTKSKGRMVGSIGDITAFSFYATKNLCAGEGGMLTTDDESIAEKVRLLRLHGMSRDAWQRYGPRGKWRYDVSAAGFKANMTDVQAALGLCQLKKIEGMQAARQRIAATYLSRLSGIDSVILPNTELSVGDRHAWHLFPIRVRAETGGLSRDEFIERMDEEGVGTSVHFLPLHQQPYYRERFPQVDLPVTEELGRELVSLPLYPSLTDPEMEAVIRAVRGTMS